MPRTRPKSLPTAVVLSSGSSDSGLDSDVLSVYSPTDDMTKSFTNIETRFQFGTELPIKERMNNLQDALCWIRDELTMMKSQDKHLAKTMIDIRSKIQQTKLELESLRDTGYDSDELDAVENKGQSFSHGSQGEIGNMKDFQMNADNFDKNKRATWVV